MKLLIQRVNHAQVAVDDKICGKIGKGLLVFIGVGHDDTRAIADKYLKKLLGLRIFEDANGKTNLSLADINGELLMVSQFTLYADFARALQTQELLIWQMNYMNICFLKPQREYLSYNMESLVRT